jgi:hypothetical protein
MDGYGREAGGSSERRASQIPTVPRELLSELARATTAYYDATPDRLEQARREYDEALRQFNGASEPPRL